MPLRRRMNPGCIRRHDAARCDSVARGNSPVSISALGWRATQALPAASPSSLVSVLPSACCLVWLRWQGRRAMEKRNHVTRVTIQYGQFVVHCSAVRCERVVSSRKGCGNEWIAGTFDLFLEGNKIVLTKILGCQHFHSVLYAGDKSGRHLSLARRARPEPNARRSKRRSRHLHDYVERILARI